nr:MAG TPA: hypothetical protein [Bacteriophage sp.]
MFSNGLNSCCFQKYFDNAPFPRLQYVKFSAGAELYAVPISFLITGVAESPIFIDFSG